MNRRLHDFDPLTGEAVYHTEAEAALPLSQKIQKLWQEVPFAKLKEERLEQGEDIEVDDAGEQDLAPGELTQAQVLELKRDMSMKLG
jgi:hypothetical protein